jgi:type II secretory pathway pseudopilin PulG
MLSTCSPERRRRWRAFSLMETLVTVLMVMMIFGLVADLLSGALRVARVQRQKTEAAEVVQLALTRLLSELREASQIDYAGTEVTFYKFNAARTEVAATEPNRFRYTLKVRYHLNSENTLLRTVEEWESASLSSATHVVADGVRGFSVTEDSGTGNAVVALTVDIGGALRTLTSEVAPMGVAP